jgi:serine protease Do
MMQCAIRFDSYRSFIVVIGLTILAFPQLATRAFANQIVVGNTPLSKDTQDAGQSQTEKIPGIVKEAEQKRIQMIREVSPAVVAIFSSSGDGGGSGVLISPDGFALSNFHVTSGAGNFMKCGLNDGKLYDAVIVGIDPTGDVALIQLQGRQDFPFARMGNSDLLKPGDAVFAMGNPFLLATDFTPTITAGIVSGLHRYQYPAGTFLEYADCIQTDASINPGNSGGPLFNLQGELIGINGRGSFEKRGRVNSGAGYAISINQIRYFLGHLKSGRIVDHATLGATVRSGSSREVLVDQVLEGSSAWNAGLREGDEIVTFAGRPMGSVNQFKNVLGIFPKGWSLPMVYRRDGQKQEILVELAALHTDTELIEFASGGAVRPAEKPGQPKPGQPKPEEKPTPQESPPEGHSEKPAEKLSPELKKLFQSKAGFTNYHFNQREQKRLIAHLASLSSWRGATGLWKFAGDDAKGTSLSLILSPDGAGMQWGETPFLQPAAGANWIDEPPSSGGFLAAMLHWKWLLTEGPEAFSDVYYLGTQPLDGQLGDALNTPLYDALVLSKTGATMTVFFREDGVIAGFDFKASRDQPTCNIRFSSWGTLGGHPFPQVLKVSSSGRSFGEFTLKTFEQKSSNSSEATR